MPAESDNSGAPVSRRGFLAASAGVGALLASQSIPGRVRARPTADRPAGRAKNLIILIADGMSIGTLTLTDLFLRDRLGRDTHWTNWIRSGEARRSLVATESANSLVTDSAASATAWSTGVRVDNGALNVTPNGLTPEPLWSRVKRTGRAAGVVTTTRITHAGFIVNHPDRNQEPEIGRQMIERNLDLALGGGALAVPAALLASRADIRALLTRDELLALRPGAHAGPVFGLFADKHMAFEVDRTSVGEIGRRQPSLAEMSRWAIDHLAQRPEGFALMIEGGRVDHAAHNNDACILTEQWAFDEALRLALDFAGARDDTLVIATTDHGNANPGISAYRAAGRSVFKRTQDIRHSFEWIVAQHKALPAPEQTAESFAALVRDATNQTIAGDDLRFLERWLAGERVDPCIGRARDYGPLGSILTNHHGVAFLTPEHTADHVELTAAGPGAERIPAFSHLTDLCAVMEHALDLPPQQAAPSTSLVRESLVLPA